MKRAAFFLLLLGCGLRRPLDEHTRPGMIQVGVLERTYLLHVPPTLPCGMPAPLVLVFHGGGGQAKGMASLTSFSELSDKEGFLVAYPEGIEKNWNDGRYVEKSRAHRENLDDLAFIHALIDDIAKRHPVDPRRIYATGISNGGFFSNLLGARMSTRIAAIAPVVGGMAPTVADGFKPDQPVSVLILQGTDDPLVPYDGGDVRFGRGQTIPTEEVVKKWVDHDGCGPATTDVLPDLDPGDGTYVSRTRYSVGRGGTEVMLYRIEGGGHTWPGGPQYLPMGLVGRVCRDIDATSIIWDFFKSHPKRAD